MTSVIGGARAPQAGVRGSFCGLGAAFAVARRLGRRMGAEASEHRVGGLFVWILRDEFAAKCFGEQRSLETGQRLGPRARSGSKPIDRTQSAFNARKQHRAFARSGNWNC